MALNRLSAAVITECVYVSFCGQIKNLQAEVVSLKREDTETPKAITADLEELRSM